MLLLTEISLIVNGRRMLLVRRLLETSVSFPEYTPFF